MNLAACKRLPLRPLHAVWYRAISAEHGKSPLGTDQTLLAPTRSHPGQAARSPFETLYLAENQLVTFFEVGALPGPPDQPIAHPSKSEVLAIDVSVRLRSVADLTDGGQLAMLETSVQELTGSWIIYPPDEAPTQRLGAALFAARDVEGSLAVSAVIPRCKTLIVFPNKLRPGQRTRVR
jgi:hypothetical protein